VTWIEFDKAKVAKVPDGDPIKLGFTELFPRAGHAKPESIELAFNCYILILGSRVVLIDAGIGAEKNRADYPDYHRRPAGFLEKLDNLGISPGNVNYVVCTHLHPDHVGWNTILDEDDWVPTFSNAVYCFPQADFDHLADRYQGGERDRWQMAAFADSILPVRKSGQCILFGLSLDLGGGLMVRQYSGHSPGHSAIFLTMDDCRLVFSGDVFHHPLQLENPDLRPVYDQDPSRAADSRKLLIGELKRRPTVLMPAHFAVTNYGCG